MEFNFGFRVGDTLYVAYPKYHKVCRLKTDCIKIFEDDVTVHGYVYGLHGNYGTPSEFSVKYLDKRVIFRKRSDAKKWLEKNLSK